MLHRKPAHAQWFGVRCGLSVCPIHGQWKSGPLWKKGTIQLINVVHLALCNHHRHSYRLIGMLGCSCCLQSCTNCCGENIIPPKKTEDNIARLQCDGLAVLWADRCSIRGPPPAAETGNIQSGALIKQRYTRIFLQMCGHFSPLVEKGELSDSLWPIFHPLWPYMANDRDAAVWIQDGVFYLYFISIKLRCML